MDFALDDITEILAFREREEPPCRYVMDLMRSRIEAIEQRLRDLERLRDELTALYEAGQRLPEGAWMKDCVCHIIVTSVTGGEDDHRQTTF